MFIMVGGNGKNACIRTCAAVVKGAVQNCNSSGVRTGGSGDDDASLLSSVITGCVNIVNLVNNIVKCK